MLHARAAPAFIACARCQHPSLAHVAGRFCCTQTLHLHTLPVHGASTQSAETSHSSAEASSLTRGGTTLKHGGVLTRARRRHTQGRRRPHSSVEAYSLKCGVAGAHCQPPSPPHVAGRFLIARTRCSLHTLPVQAASTPRRHTLPGGLAARHTQPAHGAGARSQRPTLAHAAQLKHAADKCDALLRLASDTHSLSLAGPG